MVMNKVLAVIPARYNSTRFPGKPLAKILGKPMILWTWERAMKAESLNRVVIATDDARIYNVAVDAGCEVIMTPDNLKSGSDRVAYVAEKMHSDICVNLQGDEPLLNPAHIDSAVTSLMNDSSAGCATLSTPIETKSELWDENVVKVLTDNKGHAVYFSRIPIPYPAFMNRNEVDTKNYYRHIGIYVFNMDMLEKFASYPPCRTEKIERLEQLRLLHMGEKIHVTSVSAPGPGVDRMEDIEIVEKIMKTKNKSNNIISDQYGRNS